MQLYNGDCLEIMKDLSDNSVDIVISDLPYGRFKHLKWDCPIDLERMWEQLWRICKPTCPIFLFGDFKFAMEIYNSQPKYFKYEIVWNKGVTTTPLLSRKRFGKATEYILIFYKKQCVYNYAKYHKIIKKPYSKKRNIKTFKKNGVMGGGGKVNGNRDGYEPKLPLNIIEEENVVFSPMVMGKDNKMYHSKTKKYNPKLPLNVFKCNAKLKNKTIKKLTEKPQAILEHLLKYFSNEGDVCLDITMGSGSMGVACNTLNRKFIGIEKNKEFYEITKERLSSLSSSV